MTIDKRGFEFEHLVGLFAKTQDELQVQAARSVDIALVVRNWLFGWYIVEFENGGAGRAELYGKALIDQLSSRLKNVGIKGMSATNLRKFREFYLVYAEIQQALPVKSLVSEMGGKKTEQALPVTSFLAFFAPDTLRAVTSKLASRFVLGWTHYVAQLGKQLKEVQQDWKAHRTLSEPGLPDEEEGV